MTTLAIVIGAALLLAAVAAVVVYFVFFRNRIQEWKVFPGGMINFPRVGTLTNVNLDQCKAACLTTDGCKGVQYEADQKICVLRTETPTASNVSPLEGWICYAPPNNS